MTMRLESYAYWVERLVTEAALNRLHYQAARADHDAAALEFAALARRVSA